MRYGSGRPTTWIEMRGATSWATYGTSFYILTTGTGSQSWWRLPTWSRNVDKQYVIFGCIRVINKVIEFKGGNFFWDTVYTYRTQQRHHDQCRQHCMLVLTLISQAHTAMPKPKYIYWKINIFWLVIELNWTEIFLPVSMQTTLAKIWQKLLQSGNGHFWMTSTSCRCSHAHSTNTILWRQAYNV